MEYCIFMNLWTHRIVLNYWWGSLHTHQCKRHKRTHMRIKCAHAHVYALCARVSVLFWKYLRTEYWIFMKFWILVQRKVILVKIHAQFFTKFFVVAHYYLISLSLKFRKDLLPCNKKSQTYVPSPSSPSCDLNFYRICKPFFLLFTDSPCAAPI